MCIFIPFIMSESCQKKSLQKHVKVLWVLQKNFVRIPWVAWGHGTSHWTGALSLLEYFECMQQDSVFHLCLHHIQYGTTYNMAGHQEHGTTFLLVPLLIPQEPAACWYIPAYLAGSYGY